MRDTDTVWNKRSKLEVFLGKRYQFPDVTILGYMCCVPIIYPQLQICDPASSRSIPKLFQPFHEVCFCFFDDLICDSDLIRVARFALFGRGTTMNQRKYACKEHLTVKCLKYRQI
jgi:hypothetical protein